MARTPPLVSAKPSPIASHLNFDFAGCVANLTAEMQRGILDEHVRVLASHDQTLHSAMCNLRQENRRLRQKLFNESEAAFRALDIRGTNHKSAEDDEFPAPEEMLPDLPAETRSHRPAQSNYATPGSPLIVLPATPKALPHTMSCEVELSHAHRAVTAHHVLLPRKTSGLEGNGKDCFVDHDQDAKSLKNGRSGSGTTKAKSPRSRSNLTRGKSHWSSKSRSTLAMDHFTVWPEWESLEGEDSLETHASRLSEDSILETGASDMRDLYEASFLDKSSCSKYVLSPYSLPVLIWELVALPLLLYDLMLIPMEVFDLPPNAMYMESISKIIVVYWTLDIARKMMQGYIKRDGTVVMTHQQILYGYICSHRFFLDISITLIDWLLLVGYEGGLMEAAGTIRVTKMARVYRMIRLVRLVRLRKLQRIMNKMQDRVNSAFLSTLLTISFNLGMVVGITHCLACLWYLLGTTIGDWFINHGRVNWASVVFKPEDGWHYRYFTSLHWSITQFTPGSMEVQPKNTVERCFAVMVLIFGMVVFSSFVSSVTNAMAHVQSFSAKYRQQFWLFRRYCRQHKVSDELVQRVNRYINLVLRPQMGTVQFKDVQLFPLLSEPLYIELLTELHVPQLTSHPFFATLCRKNPFHGMIRKLCCSAVKQDYFSRNDVVFCKGQTSNDMYFVTKGKLQYSVKYGGTDNSLRTNQPLKDADWCCEAGLWTWWAHAGNMCASSECILVLLNSTAFRASCSEYSMDLILVRRYGQLFVKHLINLQHQGLAITDVFSDNSPLENPEIQKLIANVDVVRVKSMGATALEGVASIFPGQTNGHVHSHDAASETVVSHGTIRTMEV